MLNALVSRAERLTRSKVARGYVAARLCRRAVMSPRGIVGAVVSRAVMSCYENIVKTMSLVILKTLF
jgi:hypothetical protein